MHRRFTLIAALFTGALAAAVALPLVSACQRLASDSSFFAADAQAAAIAAPPPTAESVKQQQVTQLPSLAPLVKQLRPVVVNINSKIKPRGGRVAQRLPQGHPRLRQQPQQDEDNSDDDSPQDPMERFFRYFGQPSPGDQQERHGLGS